MRILADTKDMSRDDWLELRRRSIGGSDAAVILGLNQFRSQYTLWADKKGILNYKEDNEAMRIGRDMEDYVANRFCEATGKKVRRRNAMFLHDNYDFISANIDRDIVGENAGLECKTTNIFAGCDFEGGEIPPYYYCQCVHYMSVMGYEKMYLAVLVLGKAFHLFEIERDENEVKALNDAEKSWWEKYILSDNIPDIDGSESTAQTLKALYPLSKDGSVSLRGDEELIRSLLAVKVLKKEVDAQIAEYQNKIAALMGENEMAECDGYTVFYKTQERNCLDTKKLRSEMPDIYKKYTNTSKIRMMKIKEV